MLSSAKRKRRRQKSWIRELRKWRDRAASAHAPTDAVGEEGPIEALVDRRIRFAANEHTFATWIINAHAKNMSGAIFLCKHLDAIVNVEPDSSESACDPELYHHDPEEDERVMHIDSYKLGDAEDDSGNPLSVALYGSWWASPKPDHPRVRELLSVAGDDDDGADRYDIEDARILCGPMWVAGDVSIEAIQSEHWIRRFPDPGRDGAFAIGHAVTSTATPLVANATEYELRASCLSSGPPSTVHPSLYFDPRFWCDTGCKTASIRERAITESMSPMRTIGPYRALGWNARLDLLDDDALVDVPLPDTVQYFARCLLKRCLPATKRSAIMAEELILNPLEPLSSLSASATSSIETQPVCAFCGTGCASMWTLSVGSPILLGALCAARFLAGRAMVEYVRENPALWSDLAKLTTDSRLKHLGCTLDVFNEVSFNLQASVRANANTSLASTIIRKRFLGSV
ncbi:hypothetical protein CYMTET_37375 [Cymbomonas tetramitiformis]|uniref:Uncharacterized protein n=1 Tax=Cymbomonas tetramitiformis TaxID=36881 RepID=A0AAE0CE64_9CHLO|nr:hypothetical protein CYMTET_37375 [Cymbomonas tetramitiformis]